MATAKEGDRVTVSYIGTLDNGRIFDSTENDPLSFTIGSGEVFPALEKAVCGMAVGEAKNIFIPSDEAYGPRRDENVKVFPKSKLPEGVEFQVGQKMQIRVSEGQEIVMIVTKVTDTEVTLDGNHFLAGLDLTFALRLDAIE